MISYKNCCMSVALELSLYPHESCTGAVAQEIMTRIQSTMQILVHSSWQCFWTWGPFKNRVAGVCVEVEVCCWKVGGFPPPKKTPPIRHSECAKSSKIRFQGQDRTVATHNIIPSPYQQGWTLLCSGATIFSNQPMRQLPKSSLYV